MHNSNLQTVGLLCHGKTEMMLKHGLQVKIVRNFNGKIDRMLKCGLQAIMKVQLQW